MDDKTTDKIIKRLEDLWLSIKDKDESYRQARFEVLHTLNSYRRKKFRSIAQEIILEEVNNSFNPFS